MPLRTAVALGCALLLAACAARRGDVVIGRDLIILGAMDRAIIDGVLAEHVGELEACYRREFKRAPSLEGEVRVKFEIAKDGSVQSAEIKRTTLNNVAVERCVTERFLGMTFPALPESRLVIASYPLLFSPR